MFCWQSAKAIIKLRSFFFVLAPKKIIISHIWYFLLRLGCMLIHGGGDIHKELINIWNFYIKISADFARLERRVLSGGPLGIEKRVIMTIKTIKKATSTSIGSSLNGASTSNSDIRRSGARRNIFNCVPDQKDLKEQAKKLEG